MCNISKTKRVASSGLSLVEVLVGAAVTVLIFVALMGSVRALLALVNASRAQTGAVALANAQIEYLRTLPYDSVGTVNGIPAGSVSQNEELLQNGRTFFRRTLIQYVDAPEDGTGAGDANGITADYKRAKIEISWNQNGATSTYALISNIVPRGIETVAGGGTLTVNVFDAAVAPVLNAAVRVVNDSTSPSIDVTAYTNASGVVVFPGAPAAANYEIAVTKSGYSSAGTYAASVDNPNPSPAPVAVVEGTVSTMNFAIDRVSSLSLTTSGPPETESFFDTFADTSQINALESATVQSGSIVLTGAPGSYALSGEAYATGTAPATLDTWSETSWTETIPASTGITYRVFAVDVAGTRTLIPDAALPGNSAGFSTSPVSLENIATSTYPSLALGATLASDSVDTPSVDSWTISYITARPPLSDIDIAVTGSKSIGTDGNAQPIPKYSETVTTNVAGTYVIPEIEWDLYTVTVPSASGYDVAEACDVVPITVTPDTVRAVRLTLVPHTLHSLKVLVTDSSGAAISGATAHLSGSGYYESIATSSCGQAFFDNLDDQNIYTLEISAPGYTTATMSNYTLGGYTLQTVSLN